MTGFRDRPEFERGRRGEQIVADWLKRRECYVIPSYDYSGEDGNKAPRLDGLWTGYPVPDLDVSRNGNRFWVEVKTKGYSPLWELAPGGPKHTHGIELRLLEHYQTVQAISGSPCYLFIFEESTRLLLAERMDVLGAPVSIGSDGRGKKIAYWFRAQFRELARIEALCPGSQ